MKDYECLIKPSLFIGSSFAKGYAIAKDICNHLRFEYEMNLWKETFMFGSGTLESLIAEGDKNDFSIIIFTGDDIREKNGNKVLSPRENVIFELGLFIGKLGRERTILMVDESDKIEILSDYIGTTCLYFPSINGKILPEDIGKVCDGIKNQVTKIGIKQPLLVQAKRKENEILETFDYSYLANDIIASTRELKILHTFIYPFTMRSDSDHQKNKEKITCNLEGVIEKQPHFKAKFLFVNPFSPFVELRKKQQTFNVNYADDLIDQYGYLYEIIYLNKFKIPTANIEVKIFDQVPPFALFQTDNIINLGAYAKNKETFKSNWLKFEKSKLANLGTLIEKLFKKLWEDDSTFDVHQYYFLSINKSIIIISNLKMFIL